MVVVMIGSITYDGLAENPAWLKVGVHLRDGVDRLGLKAQRPAALVDQGDRAALVVRAVPGASEAK